MQHGSSLCQCQQDDDVRRADPGRPGNYRICATPSDYPAQLIAESLHRSLRPVSLSSAVRGRDIRRAGASCGSQMVARRVLAIRLLHIAGLSPVLGGLRLALLGLRFAARVAVRRVPLANQQPWSRLHLWSGWMAALCNLYVGRGKSPEGAGITLQKKPDASVV
jgi:hypothetical protein